MRAFKEDCIETPVKLLTNPFTVHMKTSIDIDQELLKRAQELFKDKSIDEIVALALKVLIQKTGTEARQELLKMQGKVRWEGDLDEMRTRDNDEN